MEILLSIEDAMNPKITICREILSYNRVLQDTLYRRKLTVQDSYKMHITNTFLSGTEIFDTLPARPATMVVERCKIQFHLMY